MDLWKYFYIILVNQNFVIKMYVRLVQPIKRNSFLVKHDQSILVTRSIILKVIKVIKVIKFIRQEDYFVHLVS